MYGELSTKVARVEFDATDPRPMPHRGGLVFPMTDQFPRTCLPALPSCVRTTRDCDGDARHETVFTVDVQVLDTDGDGIPLRGKDALFLRVRLAETFLPDVALDVDAEDRDAAVRQVAAGL